MNNSWIFVAKVPQSGYTVFFGKDIKRYLKRTETKSLIMRQDDDLIHLIPSSLEDNGINLLIKSGHYKGQLKESLNSKPLHFNLANAGYFDMKELFEECYGYRFNVSWKDETKVFIINKINK